MADAAGQSRWRHTVLGPCCAPWDEKDEPVEDLFRAPSHRLATAGLPALSVFGTAGESSALNEPLFRRTIGIFLEEIAGNGATPVVGVSGLSVAEARRRIDWAAGEGFRTFLIGPSEPCDLNDDELRMFFHALCEPYRELELIHDNPGGTRRLMRAEEYATLADLHPNLVGTRYNGADAAYIASPAGSAPELRHLLSEVGFYAGAAVGGCGLAASGSVTNPARMLDYLAAAERGDFGELTIMFRELAGLTVVVEA